MRLDKARAFLRWVGGKQRTCTQVAAAVPAFARYVEPMVGGGSVFWHLAPERALLADANPLLVATWIAVRDTPQVLAAAYREGVEGEYAQLVETVNVAMYDRQVYGEDAGPHVSSVHTCAAFLALNRRAFNGLWRVNRAGKFNAHEDKEKRGSIGKLTPEFLLACSARLQGVDIQCAPVFDVLEQCGAGDFIYLDPPFLGQYGGYGGARWDLPQQRLLLVAAETAVARGANVRISNVDHPELRELYAVHAIGTVETTRSVSCTAGGRGKVLELLVDLRGAPVRALVVEEEPCSSLPLPAPAGACSQSPHLAPTSTTREISPERSAGPIRSEASTDAPNVLPQQSCEPLPVGDAAAVFVADEHGVVLIPADMFKTGVRIQIQTPLRMLDAPFCPAPAPVKQHRTHGSKR